MKNVGPIRHCEPPHAALPFTKCRYCRTPPAHRCPQQPRRRQRQRMTEGTAMAPRNGPNNSSRANIEKTVEPRLAHTVSAAAPPSLSDIRLLPKTSIVAASNHLNSYCSCYSCWQVLRCLLCIELSCAVTVELLTHRVQKERFTLRTVFVSVTVIKEVILAFKSRQ